MEREGSCWVSGTIVSFAWVEARVVDWDVALEGGREDDGFCRDFSREGLFRVSWIMTFVSFGDNADLGLGVGLLLPFPADFVPLFLGRFSLFC